VKKQQGFGYPCAKASANGEKYLSSNLLSTSDSGNFSAIELLCDEATFVPPDLQRPCSQRSPTPAPLSTLL
jgi:hypothetical protein